MEDWLKFVRQNPLLPDCSTGKQTSWSSFSLFHGQDNSSHKAWINLEKDAIASPMHIHVLDTLGAFVTQMSLKQKSCLEWDILLRVQQITWPLRASFVLRALNTVNQTQSFLTDVTLEHVTVLLQEYKMHNLYSHNDMYEPLKQYLQQLDAWISETIQQLTQPCVTYSVLPQIMLTNKYLYQNYSTLFLVLGISSPTGSDAIHYSNLLLKREQWNTPVYHDAVSKFLCSEQIFRQRWLYESLNGSCTKDTTAETFTQDIQKLHQDLLCIDTCAQFEPKTGYCNINTSSVHQEDLASNSLVSTHNLLDLLHQCQTDYDLFYTGDFAEKENLSTLQAPFSYSSAQSFQYAFNNSDVCHAYWCTVSQGSTSLPVHNCCYTSHLCLMRQLDAVLHQGFSIAPCVSYPMYESHVTCFDSVQPISETRQVDKISSHEKIRIDLHRFSRETYKVAQESVLSMYVTYASVQYTNIDNLLSERPVLCYQNNVYLQLLELRRDITRWAISTSFILLKSVGSSNWTLKNHEFCIVEDNLRRCSTLEAFISLENSLMKLQARSKNVMQQLFNTGAEHSEMIFYAFGVQHFNSSDFDVSNVGGSFHHELITRIHTVQAQITALEENLKTKRHIHFLKTVHFWDQFVSPYLDVRVPCEPATPSGSFFTLEKPDFVESQKSQQVAFDLMSLCTSVRKIQTILFEKTRLYSYLEEFCLLFLTLLLVWCVHREEVSSETTLAIKKQVLARLPPLLVQVIENLNVHELRILPFLHISSDFGIVAIALKDGLNPEIHNVVFLHSEIFLWIALSVDVFSLNHTILSDIIPHHSTLYEDILKSIKTLTKYDLQENEPFLSQALHCFTTPHTLHDVPEALGLPIDFIKWRLMVRLHMIPCTVSYFFLNDTLKKEKVLGEGLKRQMVYRVVYSDATRNLSNRVSAKDYEKTFYRFFPVSRSLAVKEEFYDNAYMSVSWNLHQPVLLLTNAPQITPYDFFLKNGVETLQLKLRHQATTLALNKIQWNFDALQKSLPASSFNNEDVKSNQYCTLTLPGTSQSLFQTFMDNCVHHFLVENVFMYLEDVFQWQQHTENIVELLKYRKKEKELMFSRLNSAPNDAPCPFNKWNLCDLKEYKKLLLKLWDVHNLYDDPPYEKSIHATSCFGTLQQLCSLYNKGVILHCHAPNGSVSDYLSRELSFFIKTVTDLEFQGDGLLQKCESLETDWNKNKISCTHSQEKHRIENDNFIQRNLFEYLSIQEIELFLKNSSFIHLKSHSKLKKLFRLYLELEYFATVAFSQQTLPLRMFVPNPIESSFSLFLHSSNEHIMSDNSHLTGENETNTCSTSQLVFFVYSRAMSSSLPVNSEFRIKILQQCWIIAARCAIKGFYGYSTETKKCVCLNDYGIPMKTLQLMCLASRSLFSEETLPPESQLFKILLGAAKRFLFEARTTLDTWIRLRIMVQYYPVLVLDEMQLIQEKLKTKFPNLSIEIVKEKNKIIQVQVYKDKNIKTRYFPSEPLDIKEFSTYPVTINRWQVVSSILHEAAMYSDQDILVHCYNVSLEGPLLTELLETKIRDATRDCLCKLFPKGSVSDAFDREQLLYNTAGSTLNEHYFIALQEMMLKRLQQSVISRRVLPQVSSLNASLSTDTETFSMNSYATNTKTQNKSTIKTQEADQLHKTIDALLLSKPKVSTVEYKKQLEHNLSCSLQVSTSSLDPAIPSKFQFPSDLQLTVSERSGFLWTGFLKIEPKESEAILKKLFSLPSVLEEKESEFQIWVVPLFAPVAKPLLLFLRTKSHFYLKKTLGIEEFSNYANPIASNNHHATVMLLNVIIGADWSMGEEMENEMTISTEVILQKCLRPSTLTVTCDVPKCRIPSEQMELLEQDALKKSLQVLCFSTSEEDLEMHQTETVRLWIIPPEPIVVESFMSTDFPKSSQLLFGTLEIPITLLGEACCVNGSLSDVREYAASVVLSLKDQKVKDALQKKLPKFHNLRITLPRTTFHWITKPKQVMTCPVLTCDTPENEIEEKCTQNLQNSTNNANQSDTSGLFRIPKRLKQGENLPGVSTTCMDNTSKTFEEVSEISSVTLPVQKVKYHFKSHHKPCFSKRDAQKRHSPVTHHHMEHRRPSQRLFRNVVQKFAIQGDKPSLQWKRQPLVSNPVPRLFQPSHVQSIRHPPKPVVPKLYPSQIGAIDPYAPPRPSIAPQPESHRPILSPDLDSGLSPPINACMTPNRKTTPPWKQQKVNSTNCLPFKVPPALKTLIRGAAAELRLNQPTHLPPFQ
ncbi:uncharacterized protein LOC128884464 [Hylaeus volcanicus]|uniref:uncharacterized protein LOC128884464 n=1 Tax=Hylaeus volcanicus TaxID=313075 RepID=UPI0023B87469|nr:uncharacterized protein LOC128884464 [Hylaeus volcanicus]